MMTTNRYRSYPHAPDCPRRKLPPVPRRLHHQTVRHAHQAMSQ
jgi:hypothetical protein